MLTYAAGNYWNHLQSIIVSHVNDEVSLTSNFIPYPIRQNSTEANFNQFLHNFMPQDSLASLREQIKSQYPISPTYPNQTARVAALIRDSTFVCNTRQLYDAYHKNSLVYMMNYRFLANKGLAVHGSDLLPTFFTKTMSFKELLCRSNAIKFLFATFARSYQSYLTSHALYGNPNPGAHHGAADVEWPTASTGVDGNYVQGVMEPYLSENLSPPWFRVARNDPLNSRDICSFWTGIASDIMSAKSESQMEELLTIQTPESVGEL